ncbi:cobalt transporter [Mycolicibacterium aromaticivorans JS19b1 = JCM 16368]|uniref:Cobalt transporter n=1 Tax=Mycolicibacterium aromaticivorans JS19b1 = JCM 16368 TaxID=1440774 RepID=A0A064CJX0_9MYCO|nr:CbtA family protein [Mycolicibacterium aromaticivorans]KDF00855.1 cobalt transporter [Mycolicibacterium aromaticivorans JS19b1 = JCM 16368]
MPLTAELPSAVRYLVPGVMGGIVCFAFSRWLIAPLISTAVAYEGDREHAEAVLAGEAHGHGHELFSRSVQENVGAAVGIVAFAVAMGVLFVVAYTAIRSAIERRGGTADPTGLALLLSAGMFGAITLLPGLKYPPNPPTVGLEETIGARSSAFLTITVASVIAACVATAAGLAWSRRWGNWPAAALASGGYGAVMLAACTVLPGFHEVPGPLSGPDGILIEGFPAQVLADFRVYSLLNQALMWATIGVTWALLSRLAARSRRRSFGMGYVAA